MGDVLSSPNTSKGSNEGENDLVIEYININS